MKTTSRLPAGFERCPRIRLNWGYWDGRAAMAAGRKPEWARTMPVSGSYVGCPHPFDQKYGEGFWLGYAGAPHPENAL
jgi:hypothetical protein